MILRVKPQVQKLVGHYGPRVHRVRGSGHSPEFWKAEHPHGFRGWSCLHERGGLVIPVGLEDRTMISKELLLSLKS